MTSEQKPNTDSESGFQPLKFESLINGTLDATVKAQALAAQTSWEFINGVNPPNKSNTPTLSPRNFSIPKK